MEETQTPFSTTDASIEEIGERLGKLYDKAGLSKEPMFAWVQILNDMTILGEEVRRDRRREAVERAFEVLMRLLQFVGYYLSVHVIGERKDFSDIVANILRQSSFEEDNEMRIHLPEGPSKWVFSKYPKACSKCGKQPCHCLVEPWVLENRREDPEPFERFKEETNDARRALSKVSLDQFTLESLTTHFRGIYRNSYWHQDPWKIAMHASEELGEATIELSRLELYWRATQKDFKLEKKLLDEVFKVSMENLRKHAKTIKITDVRKRRLQGLESDLRRLEEKFSTGNPWDIFASYVGERFKEEVADVLSWICAITIKFDENLERLNSLPGRYKKELQGGIEALQCPWCHETQCSDICLVTHDLSSEVTEKISKF